ncbi:MAG: transcriptional regulator, IclR family [Conexibacter sp.]|nr:transcriptional regulator, IclR family [Conexibacter sp.]
MASSSPASGSPADLLGQEPGRAAYGSTRRVFRILDRVSREQRVSVPALAEELGISVSTTYHLLSLLVEEGYIVRLSQHGGYRLGPTIGVLQERRQRSGAGAAVEPALRTLARRAGCSAYFAVLCQGDQVLVTHVSTPPQSPAVGIPAGFRGPSHALALGKVLLAAAGVDAINRYLDDHVLEVYTRRTITEPSKLEAHLKAVRLRGFATDFEEFARNLYCVAVAVPARTGGTLGAIGLGTTARAPAGELKRLIRLAQGAAREVSAAE